MRLLPLFLLAFGAAGCSVAPPSPAAQAPSPAPPPFRAPPPTLPTTVPDGPLGASIQRGRALFNDTAQHAPSFVGSQLSCDNCHLSEGRQPGAAPLWAASKMYPAYRAKTGKVDTLEERIQGCFVYSMNAQQSPAGHAPPLGDPVLSDLTAYAEWLAQEATPHTTYAGRGFPDLEAAPLPPDPARGAQTYATRCAACHGPDGQGVRQGDQVVFPPLWGKDSYNWGAGMHRIPTAAAFIWGNMPLGQGRQLPVQAAWDVAAYINHQPRPADPRDAGDLTTTDAAHHTHDCAYGDLHDGRRLGGGPP